MKSRLNLPDNHDGNLWLYQNQGRVVPMHHHAELEFNLITQGTACYLLAKRKYQIRRGDLLWLFPAQEHVLIDQSPDFKMWIGVFKPQLITRIACDSNTQTMRETDPAGQFNRRLAQAVFERLNALYEEVEAGRRQRGLFNAGLAYVLLSTWNEFITADINLAGSDVHPAVEKAIYLIRDTAEGLSVEVLARQVGLSPSRLSRLFLEQTGVTLLDFRNRQRIERFLQLYGTGQRMKMLAAALEAGFGSYPQFHRVFKKIMGRSPAAYRRQL